jgi:proteasome-associated ATPase
VSQIEDGLIFLSLSQGTIVTKYSVVPVETLNIGDHVVLNFTNAVIMKKVEFKSPYALKSQSMLDWDDIGGCTEAKAELRKALELPYKNIEVFDFFKKKRIKGAILWGRPGMGKTLLGRACAGTIARVHKAESTATGFIYIKGPEILSKWVGEPEAALRGVFDQSRLHFKRYGYPAVIFFDEGDALLTRRGTRTAAGMEQTIIPQFCAEADGLEESGAFILIATNRMDILDPAVIRPGRIDRKFHVEPPTLETAMEIFNIHMRNVPVTESKDKLIDAANKKLFSLAYPLYKLETTKGPQIFTLGDLASGAMIAGLVERAISCAIDRNLNNIKLDGVSGVDFDNALTAIHREQFGLNHFDEIREFVESKKLEVTAITQCQTAQDVDSSKKESSMAVPGSALIKALTKTNEVN